MSNDDILGSSLRLTEHEMGVCKRVGDVLHQHYPGHLWGVNMQDGLVQVMNLALSGKWGFTLKEELMDPEDRKIVMAGGELLERFTVSRGKMNANEMNDKIRDARGEVIEIDNG